MDSGRIRYGFAFELLPGLPQCGHIGAWSDIFPPQSGHFTSAISTIARLFTSSGKDEQDLKVAALPASNPKGIESLSPGLSAASAKDYPGNIGIKTPNLKELNQSIRSPSLRAMPQSLSRILVHAVFSTKDRFPFLGDAALREELHRYIGGILVNLDCPPVIVGGVEDHVHSPTLSRTCQAADMIKEVKRSSSTGSKPRIHECGNSHGRMGTGFFR